MTYYGAQDLARSFRTVRGNTIQIAEEIPEEQYGFRAAPECRTVAETLVHIALAPRLQIQLHVVERRTDFVGFDFFAYIGAIGEEERKARSKSEILEFLSAEGEKYAQALEGMSEEALGERIQYPEGMTPPSKSRFEMMMAPKEHEMHHRAQLMTIERMLGITPHLTRRMNERAAEMRAAQSARG